MDIQYLNLLLYNLKTNLNLQNLADSHFLILMFGSLFFIIIVFNN